MPLHLASTGARPSVCAETSMMLPPMILEATSTTRSPSSSPASRSLMTFGTGSPILPQLMLPHRHTLFLARTTPPPSATPSSLLVTPSTSPTSFAQSPFNRPLHPLRSSLTTLQRLSEPLPRHSTRHLPTSLASTRLSTRLLASSVPCSLASPFSRTSTTVSSISR